ncbi:MAG: hypothetical protein JNG86_01125 [Verrucomicrobiaceae bacterium]|nr:hypothetical protein [Verrucomicrobiaceae bacterium]
MKPDPLQRLWELKRSLPAVKPADDSDLPPGLATRIAARWAERSASTGLLWERVTASALVASLIICGLTVWLRTEPAPRDDLMIALFSARPAPADDFPF